MDREQECVCCHQIERIASKNEEVFEHVKPTEPYDCTTDNPGFHTVWLDPWVLQAWLDYKQQYRSRACKGPEHKVHSNIAYRQLVRWCWGILGKEIRVVLPSCAVSCIRAHFPPPGNEDDFEFVGFRFHYRRTYGHVDEDSLDVYFVARRSLVDHLAIYDSLYLSFSLLTVIFT